MRSPRLVVLIGIPGSGKSTWRARHGAEAACVCPDEIRRVLHGRDFDPAREGQVWREAYRRLEALLAGGRDVIFDATNPTPAERGRLLAAARRHGAETLAVYFPIGFLEALRRNVRRRRRVPAEAIWRKLSRLAPPSAHEGFDRVITVEPS